MRAPRRSATVDRQTDRRRSGSVPVDTAHLRDHRARHDFTQGNHGSHGRHFTLTHPRPLGGPTTRSRRGQPRRPRRHVRAARGAFEPSRARVREARRRAGRLRHDRVAEQHRVFRRVFCARGNSARRRNRCRRNCRSSNSIRSSRSAIRSSWSAQTTARTAGSRRLPVGFEADATLSDAPLPERTATRGKR